MKNFSDGTSLKCGYVKNGLSSSSFHECGPGVSRRRSTEPQDSRSQASSSLVHILDRLHETQAHAYHRHFHSFHVSCSFHPVTRISDVRIPSEPERKTWRTFPLFYMRKYYLVFERYEYLLANSPSAWSQTPTTLFFAFCFLFVFAFSCLLLNQKIRWWNTDIWSEIADKINYVWNRLCDKSGVHKTNKRL